MIDPHRLHVTAPRERVWRVGRRPSPWNWAPWQYASSDTGTFPGRWDSPEPHTYRTTYAASDPHGALLEVLAHFRPDPVLIAAMADIDVDEVDETIYPTMPRGTVPGEWFASRMLTSADLSGAYVDIAHSDTIAALWGEFAAWATSEFKLPDFDGSALQNADARPLTQAISALLFRLTDEDGLPLNAGIRFLSRFGADQELWTVFEQPTDGDTSGFLSLPGAHVLIGEEPETLRAMSTLGIKIEPD